MREQLYPFSKIGTFKKAYTKMGLHDFYDLALYHGWDALTQQTMLSLAHFSSMTTSLAAAVIPNVQEDGLLHIYRTTRILHPEADETWLFDNLPYLISYLHWPPLQLHIQHQGTLFICDALISISYYVDGMNYLKTFYPKK